MRQRIPKGPELVFPRAFPYILPPRGNILKPQVFRVNVSQIGALVILE